MSTKTADRVLTEANLCGIPHKATKERKRGSSLLRSLAANGGLADFKANCPFFVTFVFLCKKKRLAG